MASRANSVYRAICWAGFFSFPVGLVLGVLDYGAHLEGGPGIGLEGGGHPGASGNALLMLGFAAGVAGFVARMLSSEPRPSLPKLVLAAIVAFFATGLAARPVFRVKWERDCASGVGRACGALAQLAPNTDPAHGELEKKACTLGDDKACSRLAKDGGDDKATACAATKDFCGRSLWSEPVCKDLDATCASN